MPSKKLVNKKQKDLGMACHTPPLKNVNQQGNAITHLWPIHPTFFNGIGPTLGNGISPCFLAF